MLRTSCDSRGRQGLGKGGESLFDFRWPAEILLRARLVADCIQPAFSFARCSPVPFFLVQRYMLSSHRFRRSSAVRRRRERAHSTPTLPENAPTLAAETQTAQQHQRMSLDAADSSNTAAQQLTAATANEQILNSPIQRSAKPSEGEAGGDSVYHTPAKFQSPPSPTASKQPLTPSSRAKESSNGWEKEPIVAPIRLSTPGARDEKNVPPIRLSTPSLLRYSPVIGLPNGNSRSNSSDLSLLKNGTIPQLNHTLRAVRAASASRPGTPSPSTPRSSSSGPPVLQNGGYSALNTPSLSGATPYLLGTPLLLGTPSGSWMSSPSVNNRPTAPFPAMTPGQTPYVPASALSTPYASGSASLQSFQLPPAQSPPILSSHAPGAFPKWGKSDDGAEMQTVNGFDFPPLVAPVAVPATVNSATALASLVSASQSPPAIQPSPPNAYLLTTTQPPSVSHTPSQSPTQQRLFRSPPSSTSGRDSMRDFLGSPTDAMSDGGAEPIEFPMELEQEEMAERAEFEANTRNVARELSKQLYDAEAEAEAAADDTRRANQTTLVLAGVATLGLLWWKRAWVEERVLRLLGR
jgi:hypothetical protein